MLVHANSVSVTRMFARMLVRMFWQVKGVDLVLGGHDHDYWVQAVGQPATMVLKSGTDFRELSELWVYPSGTTPDPSHNIPAGTDATCVALGHRFTCVTHQLAWCACEAHLFKRVLAVRG